jgi:diketogulonate reductase-like aldo/keto reductase
MQTERQRSSAMPTVRLNNGVELPVLGLGVFQSAPEQTTAAVEVAIARGYRLIDTAAAYLNEQQVGEGIRASGVDRANLFVQTKLWIGDYGYDTALRAFDVSLRKLRLDYIDLYLLHQPMPTEFDDTVAAYRAAERLLAAGRVRAIGVCNFSAELLETLIGRSETVPAVNQVEMHPCFVQPELREVHKQLGVATQAWSPLGGVNIYRPAFGAERMKNPLEQRSVLDIAAKYGKTAAQVVLRWHVEHGHSVVPKSVRPARIAENIDVFDFRLTEQEVAAIDSLDTGVRGGPEPASVNREAFNFRIPD